MSAIISGLKSILIVSLLISSIMSALLFPPTIFIGIIYTTGIEVGKNKEIARQLETYRTNIKQADRDIEEGRKVGKCVEKQ